MNAEDIFFSWGSMPELFKELVSVLRGGNDHIRDAHQIRQIERTVMRWSVLPHESCAVQTERHGNRLDRHIVDDLVIAALQEGG